MVPVALQRLWDAGALARDYRSALIDDIRQGGFHWRAGRLVVPLAREFGFCYGVDRAVQYAYEPRRRFPDRRIFLTGELIHNPHVNREMLAKGIGFLTGSYASDVDFDSLRPADVVLPDENTLDLLPRIKQRRPQLPIIVMSAQNTLLTAVKATERGAFDYLPKPFDLNLTEFSITEERKQAVDFSAPYYDVKQAVVALNGNPAAGATTVAELQSARPGAQVGTTLAFAGEPSVAPVFSADGTRAVITTTPSIYDPATNATKVVVINTTTGAQIGTALTVDSTTVVAAAVVAEDDPNTLTDWVYADLNTYQYGVKNNG